MTKRTKHSAEFKAKVALAALKGQKTIAEICQENNVHASMVHKWKTILQQGCSAAFGNESGKKDQPAEVVHLNAKIGELTMQVDFLKKALRM